MSWLDKIKPDGWPVDLQASATKQTLVLRTFCDISQLEICKPVVIRRPRSRGRIEAVDVLHAFADGDVRHTPIK